MELYIKRKFCAAHKLEGYKGKCANLHGHTFLVEVWIKGEIDPKTNMVMDFKEVKDIIDQYDHKYLNELPDFRHFQPTAEAIAVRIYAKLPFSSIARVRVWESDDCSAEVGG